MVSLAAATLCACSLGQGTGCFVNSSLDVPTCWSGPFDLQPNFFAAVPTNSAALEIRIQNGVDNETFSDGLLILVDDIGQVRGDPLPDGTPRAGLLGQPIAVSVQPGATAPGVPVLAVANPALVHATLYLNRTCRTQGVALYALESVSLEADGTCNRPEGGAEAPLPCGAANVPPPPSLAGDAGVDGGAASSGGIAASNFCSTCPCPGLSADSATSTGPPPTLANSMIRFATLFDGNSAESNAKQRLTSADFDLYMADPRDVCPGGLGPPPRCQAHLQGHFSFYFQRGRPAQPFP